MKIIKKVKLSLCVIFITLFMNQCIGNPPNDNSLLNLLLLAFTTKQPELTNLRNNSVVHTSLLRGSNGTNVEISIDGGSGKKAVMGENGNWTFRLPTGFETWRPNSIHTVAISDTLGSITTYTLRKGNNRDFNGDGYEDMVLSATGYTAPIQAGRIFVANGGPDGTISNPNTVIPLSLDGENNNDSFGSSLGLGDLNADGYADLVVGAPAFDGPPAGPAEGKVYIYYGSQNGLPGTSDAVITNNIPPPRNFGQSVSLGDINSDGFDDLAISASVAALVNGTVNIWYGSSSQLATTTIGSAQVIFTAEAIGNTFGNFILLRDINNDNIADLIVGAPNAGGGSVGKIYIWQSSSSGLVSGSATNAPIQITGEPAGEAFGVTFAVGDFNGDGNQDLWVADNLWGPIGPTNNTGRLYGWLSMNLTGAANLATNAPIQITGENVGDQFGSIPYLADLNRDGYDELMVSAVTYSTGFANQGRLYIQNGNATGTLGLPGAFPIILSGLAANDRFSSSSTFVDTNGDGILDLFIGARDVGASTGAVLHWENFLDYNNFNPNSTNFTNNFAGANAGDAFGARLGR